MGLMMLPFSISVEVCGTFTKTAFGNMIQAPFAVGEAIISVIAMLVRDWRTFHIVTSAPLFAFLLLWPLMNESPRWLIATKKYDRAQQLIRKAAKMNKVN
jgi:OCT family organic cation transporter-like MFS transporter 4/5